MILDYTKFIASIEAHTKALVAHTEALLKGGAAEAAPKPRGRPAKGESSPPDAATLSAAPTAASAAAAQVVTQATEKAPTTTAATTTAPVTVEGEKPVVIQPTIQQVADAIVGLVNSGKRPDAIAILGAFKVAKVPQLKPDQFPGVIAAVDAAKAGTLQAYLESLNNTADAGSDLI